MTPGRFFRRAAGLTAAALGAGVGAYAAYVGIAWSRYGHPAPPQADEFDPLLDRFMPSYDVAERHHIRVAAPASITLAAAKDATLDSSVVVRAIFRARELALGASNDATPRSEGLFNMVESLGWRVLFHDPGREVVVGAVTQPWVGDVTFRGVPPDEFLAFSEPGYVKILWTLRADPDGAHRSVFRTETRATTTDTSARRRFRWYWARFSPGIILIRWVLLEA